MYASDTLATEPETISLPPLVPERQQSAGAGEPSALQPETGVSSARRSLPEFSVVHAVSDRLRIRIRELQFDGELPELIKNAIGAISGVTSVRINTWCQSIVIAHDASVLSSDDLVNRLLRLKLGAIAPLEKKSIPASRLVVLTRAVLAQIERATPPLVQLLLGAAALGSCLVGLPPLVTTSLCCLSTLPIGGRAFTTALDEKKISVDGLDGLAAILMITRGNLGAASFMTALIGLGEYIRELTAQRCQKMLTDLLGLAGSSAWLVKGRKRICVPADQVHPGDMVVIYSGELVPVDGTVMSGHAGVNQANLTGESVPVEVSAGSQVYAGTFLTDGKLYVRCDAGVHSSRAGRVMELVDQAPVYETRTQNYASQMADKMVAPIIITACSAGLLSRQVDRLMSVLIFDFSTGIRISAPTAVLASMQRAGRQGILIKSGAAVERLASVDAVILDKTGTLTLGEPAVTGVISLNGCSADQVLSYAAAVEERVHHPAANAIVRHAHNLQLVIPDREKSSQQTGMGACAMVNGQLVQVGSKRMMDSLQIDLTGAQEIERQVLERGESLTYVAVGGTAAGVISYADQLRPEAPEVIKMLRKRGIKKIYMATGDHEASAMAIAKAAGITEVFSGAFPEQKAALVQNLKEQGFVVAVVGDGINDSPALAHADLGVSLHGATHAAREHADVVLTDNDLRRFPQAIDIARSAMGLVKQNLWFISVSNGAGIALAAFGLIGAALSTTLNNGSAILAAMNSLRPLITDAWSTSEESV